MGISRKNLAIMLLYAFVVQTAAAQRPDPVELRARLFGQEEWIDNALLRPTARPDGQISTAGTDVFQSLQTSRDVFTFTPLGIRFPVNFNACRLALMSNRNLNGIRTAYLCDPPQTLGYLNLIATREEAQTQEGFLAFADRNLRNEAGQIFGVGGDQSFCNARTSSGGFASTLVCEIHFTHAGRSAIYRKAFAWSNGVIVSVTTACAGVQCETALPGFDRFLSGLSIDQ